MTSSSSTDPQKERNFKPEPDSSAIPESSSSSPKTPSKRPRSTPFITHSHTKTPKSTTKQEGWTPELRLKLFEAYEACSQVKWDDVAEKMGNGKRAKECREQWQRTTGKRIKAALAEKN